MFGLTEEQKHQIEENKQKALKLRAQRAKDLQPAPNNHKNKLPNYGGLQSSTINPIHKTGANLLQKINSFKVLCLFNRNFKVNLKVSETIQILIQ